MIMQNQNKPFSMIREFHLADWITLANAVCGTSAMFAIMTYLQTTDVHHVYFACGLIVAALVFDIRELLNKLLKETLSALTFCTPPIQIMYSHPIHIPRNQQLWNVITP